MSHKPFVNADHFLTYGSAYAEWVRLVGKVHDEAEAQTQMAHLMATNYSIHFHAWGQAEMLELLTALQRRYALPFEVEAIVKRDLEMISILRKRV